MVNPVLTILFDLFLVGSALAIVAGMVNEYRASRTLAVGGGARRRTVRPVALRAHRRLDRASAAAARRRLAA